MIDTIKIYTEINKNLYDTIKSLSIVKNSVDNSRNQLLYEVINDHLVGSFDSRLSVRVGCGSKYGFCYLGYYIEIEGSYHKIVRGYNSHNGYYDLNFIVENLIQIVELSYNINLPSFDNWYLQRCDIAICYNLENQENVKSYINSLSRCQYPRRNAKFYYDESLYLSGTTTTLKIYNKMLEFKKHDIKKFNISNFDLKNYLEYINGFIRFECEIKKKCLTKMYNKKHIKILDVNYEDLKKVWCDEFMKLLKFIENDLKIVRGREEVKERLNKLYKPSKSSRLYNFYCAIQLNGLIDTKESMSSSVYYRNIKELKEAKVDFSQCYKIEECNLFYFNPFEFKEVA
jgi:II/X family phage/plasmid replication protein